MLRPEHLVIIIVVAMLLFGANRLPGTVRNIGQAIREFKKQVSREDTDDKKSG